MSTLDEAAPLIRAALAVVTEIPEVAAILYNIPQAEFARRMQEKLANPPLDYDVDAFKEFCGIK